MRKKICFASSSGGHFEQLSMLKPLMDRYDSCVVTEKTGYETAIDGVKMYYLHQINRTEKTLPLWLTINVIKSFKVMIIEQPDVIVTTGVLAVVPLCILAKMCRKKIVYIESFAKVSSPTKTGKFMYKIADRFYVQWESMKEFYPNAIYLGGIY